MKSHDLKPGQLVSVELGSLGLVKWQATSMLLRVLSEKWAITQAGFEVVLSVAARQGSPELISAPAATTPEPTADSATIILPAQPAKQRAFGLMRREGKPLEGTEFVEVRDGVAVLPITGTILPKANLFTQISGMTTLDLLSLDLERAAQSPDVRSIVLRIDSPGGALADVNEFGKHVRDVRKHKPVFAHASNIMASAAFWIGSHAQEIWIDETADVGSVGVIMTVTRQSAEDKARRVVFVSSVSPHKLSDPDDEEARKRLQAYVDELGEIFVGVIAHNRNLTAAKVEQAKGSVLIGKSAVAAGFADRLGSLEQVIAHAKQATTSMPRMHGVALSNNEEKNMAQSKIARAYAAFVNAWSEQDVESESDVPKLPQGLGAPALPAATPAPTAAPAAPAAPAQPAATPGLTTISADLREAIGQMADAFCEVLTAKNLALPAALPAIKGKFVQAAIDDRLMPLAEGSRLATLKADYTGGTAHSLTAELVPDKPATAAHVVTGQGLSANDAMDAKLEEQEREIAKRENKRAHATSA